MTRRVTHRAIAMRRAGTLVGIQATPVKLRVKAVSKVTEIDFKKFQCKILKFSINVMESKFREFSELR